MYCPSSENEKGNIIKESSVNKKSGTKVNTICPRATIRTFFRNKLKSNNIPIETSKIANSMMEMSDGMTPSVRNLIVFFAKISAGLKNEKNFNDPNHTYTIPIVIAKM